MKKVRFWAVLAIGFMSVMSVKAQSQRMMEFQNEFSKYQTQYRELMHSGKHKEAMAPLASCIAMLDTTTIFKVSPIPEAAILEQKGLLYYDYACCYALVGQKTKMRTYRQQALAALEQSVLLGYKDYNNMVNDNDLRSLRKDKKYLSLLAQVNDRQPLSVLKKSAPYAKDAAQQDILFRYQPKESKNLRMVRDYFKLDSVAGQGDELSKIINLLHFAHDNIRHDGHPSRRRQPGVCRAGRHRPLQLLQDYRQGRELSPAGHIALRDVPVDGYPGTLCDLYACRFARL